MKPTDPLHKPLSAWGLRFDDPEREAQFRAELTARVLTRQRVLIVFAFVIYLVYAVRDIALGPTFGYAPLYLRVFFILPVMIALRGWSLGREMTQEQVVSQISEFLVRGLGFR